MTNYEWLKTLDVIDIAEVLSNSNRILKSYLGDPLEIMQKWLNSERVECTNDECLLKDTNHCMTCWARADSRG